jgi:hypothetical protein
MVALSNSDVGSLKIEKLLGLANGFPEIFSGIGAEKCNSCPISR